MAARWRRSIRTMCPKAMNVTLQWESSALRIGPFPHEGEADPELIDAGAMVSAKGLSADGVDEGGFTLNNLYGHGARFYERNNKLCALPLIPTILHGYSPCLAKPLKRLVTPTGLEPVFSP